MIKYNIEVFMRKAAVLGFIFLMIFSPLSADENTNEYKNIGFSPRFLYQESQNKEIDFINLNPEFFNSGNDFFIMKKYQNNIPGNTPKNDNNVINTQENDLPGFIGSLFAFTSMSLIYSRMSYQERQIYSEGWSKMEEEEQMRKRFLENYRY